MGLSSRIVYFHQQNGKFISSKNLSDGIYQKTLIFSESLYVPKENCPGGNDKEEIISEMGRDWEKVDCKSAQA